MADKKFPDDDLYGQKREVPLETRTTYERDRDMPPSTQIRVEKEAHKGGAVWPWVLGLVLAGLIALPFLTRKPAQQAAAPPAPNNNLVGPATVGPARVGSAAVGPAVVYRGNTYVSAGQAQNFNASDMVAVGKTNGGSTVYQVQGGGGGGMAGSTLFIRTADGTFHALKAYNP